MLASTDRAGGPCEAPGDSAVPACAIQRRPIARQLFARSPGARAFKSPVASLASLRFELFELRGGSGRGGQCSQSAKSARAHVRLVAIPLRRRPDPPTHSGRSPHPGRRPGRACMVGSRAGAPPSEASGRKRSSHAQAVFVPGPTRSRAARDTPRPLRVGLGFFRVAPGRAAPRRRRAQRAARSRFCHHAPRTSSPGP
jgi:hypothetical protein